MSVNQDQVMRDTWKQFVDVMKLHTLDPESLSFLKSVFVGGYVAGHVEASDAAMKNMSVVMANVTRGVSKWAMKHPGMSLSKYSMTLLWAS